MMTSNLKKAIQLCTIYCLVGMVMIPRAAQARAVRGTITDESGGVIAGTVIEISCSKDGLFAKVARTLSESDGRFQVEATLSESCKISFSATGFQVVSRNL